MPKKKVIDEEGDTDETGIEQAAVIESKPATSATCGHVNHHHYGTDGKLESISCDLSKGHSGDHRANYMKNVGEPVHDEKGRIVKVNYHPEKAETHWGDMAGTPAGKVQVGDTDQLSLLQKDLILEILNKNPGLSIQQATAQAKASPHWNGAEIL